MLGSVMNALTSKEEGVAQSGKPHHQYRSENYELGSKNLSTE